MAQVLSFLKFRPHKKERSAKSSVLPENSADRLVMTRQMLDSAVEESKRILQEASQGKLRPYV